MGHLKKAWQGDVNECMKSFGLFREDEQIWDSKEGKSSRMENGH